ncbi:hypothetical protein CHS0354_002645 [Potamilus streckersoni]|uniref:Uncharacterized protein n=1 Tax=Potamilus streckersoni TaxID=2493646 RepID=A0AAE0RNN3_9BIVA|nr:hypothetical protein CHS0354_002645 [Potamilus streckersoni]
MALSGIAQLWLFLKIRNGQQIKIYNNVKNNIDNLPTTYVEAIDRVKNGDGKYAFILQGYAAQYAAAQQPCDLMVVGEARFDRVYGFACRKSFDFCRQLDIAILHMKEKQDLEMLRKKWFLRDCFSDLQHEYMYKGIPILDKGEAPNMAQMKGVTLKRFGGPLLILLIGSILSSLALVGEIIWSRLYGEPNGVHLAEDQEKIREAVDMVP